MNPMKEISVDIEQYRRLQKCENNVGRSVWELLKRWNGGRGSELQIDADSDTLQKTTGNGVDEILEDKYSDGFEQRAWCDEWISRR